jgi:hypothetical protein
MRDVTVCWRLNSLGVQRLGVQLYTTDTRFVCCAQVIVITNDGVAQMI